MFCRGKSANYQGIKNLSKSLKFLYSKVDGTKDYYLLLGVNQSSNSNDIKQAFLKLTKQFHPDINPTSGEKFKEINEAYKVLIDADKKKEYDQIRTQNSFNVSVFDYSKYHQGNRNNNNREEDLYKKYGFTNDYDKKKQQDDDEFFYYWEKKGNYNYASNKAHAHKTQDNIQWEQYESNDNEEQLKEQIRKIFQGQDERFNEFIDSLKNNKEFQHKNDEEKQMFQELKIKQKEWEDQQQEPSRPYYGYKPYDYFIRNSTKFQEMHQNNSYYDSDSQNKFNRNPREEIWNDIHSKEAKQRMVEDIKRQEEHKERMRIQNVIKRGKGEWEQIINQISCR